jgi:hypothetical protein
MNLPAARRVTDVDSAVEVQRGDQVGEFVGVRIQVIAFPGLVRAPVPSAVVRDAAVSAGRQENHLVLPRIGGQRPPVTKDQRLACPPILVKDLRSIFGCMLGIFFLSLNWD